MNCRFVLLSLIMWSCFLFAQDPSTSARLQRTPEEEALKQTERLVRELNLHDSIRIDTLYKMHLKYANLRRKGLTRAQEMERMNAIIAELKLILTPREFDQFMNHPAEQPRMPRGAGFVAPRQMERISGEKATDIPPMQKERR